MAEGFALVLAAVLLISVSPAQAITCYSCDPCPETFNATQTATCTGANWCNTTITGGRTTRTCDMTSPPGFGSLSSCSSTFRTGQARVTQCRCNYNRCNQECTCGGTTGLHPVTLVVITTALLGVASRHVI